MPISIIQYCMMLATGIFVVILSYFINRPKKLTQKPYRLTTIIPPMNDIEIINVNYNGIQTKGVIDPHHGRQRAGYILIGTDLFHTVNVDKVDWEKMKKASITPKRILMFAVLMQINGVTYQINNLN